MSFDFSALNPYREPAWRWQRANRLATTGSRLNRRRDDIWVSKAAAFCNAQLAADTEQKVAELIRKYPAMYVAWLFWNAGAENEIFTRGEIEARILAGQPFAEIAVRHCVMPEAIAAYEKVFFNVADRLHNRSYIIHQVIGPVAQTGLTPREPVVLWKLYGYYCGPLAIDMMVELFPDPIRPSRRTDLKSFCGAMLTQTLARKALISAQTIRANGSHEQLELIEKFLRMMEVEAATGNGDGGSSTGFVSNVEAMLGAVPWSVGQQAHARLQSEAITVMATMDANGIEMSPSELMTLSVDGQAPDPLLLEGAKFPDVKQLTMNPDPPAETT
jgi:hypothetical protein